MNKYIIKGYYSHNYTGLSESDDTNDYSNAIDTVHEYCCKGNYVIIENTDSGKSLNINPDYWMQAIDNGDVIDEIKELY